VTICPKGDNSPKRRQFAQKAHFAQSGHCGIKIHRHDPENSYVRSEPKYFVSILQKCAPVKKPRRDRRFLKNWRKKSKMDCCNIDSVMGERKMAFAFCQRLLCKRQLCIVFFAIYYTRKHAARTYNVITPLQWFYGQAPNEQGPNDQGPNNQGPNIVKQTRNE
jgi:hypothetical protein